MTSIEQIFRRVTGNDSKPAPSNAGAEGKRAAGRRNGNRPLYRWAFTIHKWAGLIGAIWLAVLGLTGFFLNNDGWRFLQQTAVPDWLVSERIQQNAARNVTRHLQIDPDNSTLRLAGGPRGLWRTSDGGDTWRPTQFKGDAHPQIFAIEADPALGWGRLWIGSDEGLYVSTDRGDNARLASLAGERVTALSRGATPTEMLGVIGKSRIFRFDAETPSQIEILDLAPLPPEARPEEVGLQKFLRALHFGRGLFDAPTSRLINEVGGLAMFVLALTGLTYWALGKLWRMQAKAGVRGMSSEAKRTTTAWLYRTHAATIGIICFPILLYLPLTGIVVGHDRELGGMLRGIETPRALFTPAFKLTSWDERIDALVGYPGAPGAFSVGNMLGMFTTVDDGKNWAREEDLKGRPISGANRMRRIGDRVVIMPGGGSTALIGGDDFAFREASLSPPDRMHKEHGGAEREKAEGAPVQRPPKPMTRGAGEGRLSPFDVSASEGGLLWRTGTKLVVTDLDSNHLKMLDVTQPVAPGVPMFLWLRSIHTGMLFWTEWRWVNDAFATLAVFLVLSGLVRWWRQKWM